MHIKTDALNRNRIKTKHQPSAKSIYHLLKKTPTKQGTYLQIGVGTNNEQINIKTKTQNVCMENPPNMNHQIRRNDKN